WVEELAKNIDADLSRIQYVTNNFKLSLIKLSPEGHLPEWREERNSCV
ncbi:10820_t:CDS:1, partial [Scutellospora calospora]